MKTSVGDPLAGVSEQEREIMSRLSSVSNPMAHR